MKASEMAALADANKSKVEADADKELQAICTNIRLVSEGGYKTTQHVIRYSQNELQLAAWGYRLSEDRDNMRPRSSASLIYGDSFIIQW